jgi:hypothetical protein
MFSLSQNTAMLMCGIIVTTGEGPGDVPAAASNAALLDMF